MKLSEMNTDKLLDVMCDLTPYFGNILKDDELKSILKDKIEATEENKDKIQELGFEKGIDNVVKLIPVLFKKHREDFYNIISIMNDKSLEDIKKQSAFTTIKEIVEVVKDKETMNFLLSLIKSA